MSKKKWMFRIFSTVLICAVIATIIASFICADYFSKNFDMSGPKAGLLFGNLFCMFFAGYAIVFGADLHYTVYYFLISQSKAVLKTVLNIICVIIDCASVAMMIFTAVTNIGYKIPTLLLLVGVILLLRFIYFIYSEIRASKARKSDKIPHN